MKFGHLTEDNMRSIFLETLYVKCGGESILRLFHGKTKLIISLNQWFKFLYTLFLLYAKLSAN